MRETHVVQGAVHAQRVATGGAWGQGGGGRGGLALDTLAFVHHNWRLMTDNGDRAAWMMHKGRPSRPQRWIEPNDREIQE